MHAAGAAKVTVHLLLLKVYRLEQPVTIQLPQGANYTYHNQPPSPQAHALTHFLIKNIYR